MEDLLLSFLTFLAILLASADAALIIAYLISLIFCKED